MLKERAYSLEKKKKSKEELALSYILHLHFVYFMSDDNKKPNNQMSWQFTSEELKSALNTWDELNKKEKKLAPDEQLLSDMKKLIVDIEQKIKSFDN